MGGIFKRVMLGLILMGVVAFLALLPGCKTNQPQVQDQFGDRIPIAVPGQVVVDGRTYESDGRTVATIKILPDDVEYAGEATWDAMAGSQAPGVETFRAYAIKGTPKTEAVAVRFESANGKYYYFLEYRAAATTTETAPSTTSTSTTVTAEADLQALIKQMAKPYPDGDVRYASSNPYDYTRNNPAFDAIVAMGYDALPGLEANLATDSGLGGYLDCIAIEKIMRCDLKQFDRFMWASAPSFRAQWNRYLKEMPSMVLEAFALSDYAPPKPIGLEKLGAPAVPYVIDQAQRSGLWDESEVVQTLETLMLDARPAATISEFAELNHAAIEKLRAYVEKR